MDKQQALRKVIREEIQRLEEAEDDAMPDHLEDKARDMGFDPMDRQDLQYTTFSEGALSMKLAGGAQAVLGLSEGYPVLWIEVGDGVSLTWPTKDAGYVLDNLRNIDALIQNTLNKGREDNVYDLPPRRSNNLADEIDQMYDAEQVVKFPT